MPAAPRGYLALLRLPSAAPLTLWAALARLQYGVLPLATLLLLADVRGSYAEAGAVTAAVGLTAGLLGPLRARAADRFGHGRVLVVAAVAYALGTGKAQHGRHCRELEAAEQQADRRRGQKPEEEPRAAPRHARSHRDVVADGVAQGPQHYRHSEAREQQEQRRRDQHRPGCEARDGDRSDQRADDVQHLLGHGVEGERRPQRWRLVACDVAPGRPHHRPDRRRETACEKCGGDEQRQWRGRQQEQQPDAELAGVPAALIAIGSIGGGLLYGRRLWPGGVRSQAVVLVLGSASAVLIAAAVSGWLVPMLLAFLVAGVFVSPAVVASYVIADDAVTGSSAEATSWVNSAFNVGTAFGTALAGVLVDARGPEAAMLALAVTTVALTAVAVAAARPRSRVMKA